MKSATSSTITVPFTKEQARRVRDQHKYLEGQEYLENEASIGTIECVAITPYDDINRYIFFEYYLDCLNPQKALEYYHGPFYDVAFVVKTYSDQKLMLKNAVGYIPANEMQQ